MQNNLKKIYLLLVFLISLISVSAFEISSVSINPSIIYTDTQAEGNVTAIGENSTFIIEYFWYVDDVLKISGNYSGYANNTNTLISTLGTGNYTKDQTINFTVNAHNITNSSADDSATKPVSNSLPSITEMQSVSDITLIQFSTKTANVLFNVSDADGYSDLNDSTAKCNLTKTGEADRLSSSCSLQDQYDAQTVYNCSIDMYFYDGSGTWDLACYIEDNDAIDDSDSGTVTVNDLNYVIQDITVLDWDANIGEDREADNPLIFTNGGNQNYNTFTITSSNATYGSNNIPNDKFMVDEQAGQTSGQTYLSSSGVEWVQGTLPRCSSPCSANSTEIGYFYADILSVSAGTYTSISNWVISLS